jgi:heme/copper-type cytochrome/quinol oxidase subunit 2
VASGVLNTFRQVGAAIGIALAGAILANRAHAAAVGGADPAHAFVHGLDYALRVSAAICLGAAVIAAVLVRKYQYAEADQRPLAEAA